jgi:hypothetical protein
LHLSQILTNRTKVALTDPFRKTNQKRNNEPMKPTSLAASKIQKTNRGLEYLSGNPCQWLLGNALGHGTPTPGGCKLYCKKDLFGWLSHSQLWPPHISQPLNVLLPYTLGHKEKIIMSKTNIMNFYKLKMLFVLAIQTNTPTTLYIPVGIKNCVVWTQ